MDGNNHHIRNLILNYDDTSKYYYAIFDENYGSISNIEFIDCKIVVKKKISKFATRFIYGANYGYQSNIKLTNVKLEYNKKTLKKIV